MEEVNAAIAQEVDALQEIQKGYDTVQEQQPDLRMVVMQDEFLYLKEQINNALGELITLIVGLEDRFEALEKRLELFNKKSGQKI